MEARIEERFFDDGAFPAPETLKKSVIESRKADEVRPQPYTGKTLPLAHMTVQNYGKRIDEWFARVAAEPKPPNRKQ